MKFLAIIHFDDRAAAVYWCASRETADERLAQWMRDNPTLAFRRATIAECLWTIEN